MLTTCTTYVRQKFYTLWGTIEDSERTNLENRLRKGHFKAEGVDAVALSEPT